MKSTPQTLLLPFIKQSHIGTSVNKPPAGGRSTPAGIMYGVDP
jgi:hypothetical protein